MQTNPESAAVEAVANMTPAKFTTRLADGSLILCVTESEHTQIVNANKSALDALRGEVRELTADRDSWREQAEDRLLEWDKLRGEVETCRRLLSEKVSAETMLRELHITPAGLSAQVEGGMAGILMQSIVDQFRQIGGPNFFEMKFIADGQQYVLTVQRSAGLTPADKMRAAEQRADAAERRVAECETVLAMVLGGMLSGAIKCKPLMTKRDGDYVVGSLQELIEQTLTKVTP